MDEYEVKLTAVFRGCYCIVKASNAAEASAIVASGNFGEYGIETSGAELSDWEVIKTEKLSTPTGP